MSLGIFFGLNMTNKAKKEDHLSVKTKECINYIVLKSIEFFTEEFSLLDIEKYIVDDFIHFHSRGLELDFEDIKEMVTQYSLDDPKEEIMSSFLKEILNPIKKI